MNVSDLGYALTQLAHNFGAVTVTAGAACARWRALPITPPLQRRLARLVLAGWTVQAASGMTFGAISYFTYGHLPDIHGIAVAALVVKMACAAAGLTVSGVLLARGAAWTDTQRRSRWTALTVFGATALAAAAFLRWFS